MIAEASQVPPPPTGASTAFVPFEIGAKQLYHIPDPQGRRLIEGWASLRGIDWQDEEILPESFEQGAMEYLTKNPVLLWDHQRHIPLGKVLALTITDDGLFMQAEIFSPTPQELEQIQKLDQLSEGYHSYLLKANEVWWGIRQGLIRGLSVQGRTRRRAVWSPELGKFVHQGVETLLHEISVTPTQVHPGSRITGVNTLAKALEITKALPLIERNYTMNEKQKRAMELQSMYFESLKDLGDGTEVPEEMLRVHELLSKAIKVDEPSTALPTVASPNVAKNEKETPEQLAVLETLLKKALQQHLAPLQEQVNRLSQQPAPIRARVTMNAPEGAAPKPLGQTNSYGGAIEKALQVISTSKNGISNFGQGDYHGCDGLTAMKLIFARSRTKNKPIVFDDVTLGAAGQTLLKKCMNE